MTVENLPSACIAFVRSCAVGLIVSAPPANDGKGSCSPHSSGATGTSVDSDMLDCTRKVAGGLAFGDKTWGSSI